MVRKANKSFFKSRKFLLYGSVVAVVLIVGVTVYALNNPQSPNTTAPPQASKTKVQSGGAAYSTTPLNSSAVNAPNDARKTGSTSVDSTTLNTPTANPEIGVTITRVSTAPAKVYTVVTGVTTGTCTLTATQAGHAPVTATSTVGLSVNSYECEDFGLSAGQFASGHWHITVTLDSGGSSATSTPWDT